MIKENKQQADRFNKGKPRFSLVSPIAHEELAKVLTMGAQKYAPYNWMKGLPFMEVIDSLERHVNAFKRGENMDKESGLHHMAHVMCNAMFLIEYIEAGKENFDDRPNKPDNKVTKINEVSDAYSKGFKAGQEFEKNRLPIKDGWIIPPDSKPWNGHFSGGPVPRHYTTTSLGPDSGSQILLVDHLSLIDNDPKSDK